MEIVVYKCENYWPKMWKLLTKNVRFVTKCETSLNNNFHIKCFRKFSAIVRQYYFIFGLNLFILHRLRNKFSELILSRSRCLLPGWLNQYSCPLCGLWKTWSPISAPPGFEPTTFGSVVGHSTTGPTFLHKLVRGKLSWDEDRRLRPLGHGVP